MRVNPNPIWLVSLSKEEIQAHRGAHVRMQQGGSHLQSKERGLDEATPANILVVDFLWSRTVRKEISVVYPVCGILLWQP